MNRIEDTQSILYLASAFDKSDKNPILVEQEIPKAAFIALIVFNRGDSPVKAYAGLGSDGLERRIEPRQKKKFSFVTSQSYTLKDVRMKVMKVLSEKVYDSTKLFKSSLQSVRNEDSHEKEVKNSELIKRTSFSLKKERSIDSDTTELNTFSSSRVFQVSDLQRNTYAFIKLFDLDTGQKVTTSLFSGHRISVTVKNPIGKQIRVCSCPMDEERKAFKIYEGFSISFIDPYESQELGYFIPEVKKGGTMNGMISLLINENPIRPGTPCYKVQCPFKIQEPVITQSSEGRKETKRKDSVMDGFEKEVWFTGSQEEFALEVRPLFFYDIHSGSGNRPSVGSGI